MVALVSFINKVSSNEERTFSFKLYSFLFLALKTQSSSSMPVKAGTIPQFFLDIYIFKTRH